MKNAVLLIASLTILSATIMGCSSKEPEKVEESIELSNLIPNPTSFFTDEKNEFEFVTSEQEYIVYLDYVTEEEWNNYIAECQEYETWKKETYRTNYCWYVESLDGTYQLYLDRYGDNNEYMTIIVEETCEEKGE